MAKLAREADIGRSNSGRGLLMSEHRLLLDTFANARRTGDDLVGLQPDVIAGSGNLKESDLVELKRRRAVPFITRQWEPEVWAGAHPFE